MKIPPGPSIIEKVWAELDAETNTLMAIRGECHFETEEEQELAEEAQRGLCLGIAKALAIVLNPYEPDVDEIRREAMRRYKTRGNDE